MKYMKKRHHLILAAALMLMSQAAMADLPSATGSATQQQPVQPYGQGQGYGSNYDNQQYYPPVQNATIQTPQKSSDLLWLFTGSDSSLTDQVHNGFRSNSQTTFWNRIWSIAKGAAYRKFVTPIEYRLGAMENQVANIGTNVLQGNSNSATQYCYECMHPSTNPYATNPNSMAPIFGGSSTSATPSTSSGQIQY